MGEDGSLKRGKKPGIGRDSKRVWAAVVIIIIIIPVLCGLAVSAFRKKGATAKVSVFAGKALEGEPFPYVFIEFMPGYDNPTGEMICQKVTGPEGEAVAELPYGEYTVKWHARWVGGGYYPVYQNVEVREETVTLRKWLFPLPKGKGAYILMEWGTEADVDLCVYSEQSGRCLGRETTLENPGGFCYGDNDGEKGYELAYLDDLHLDTYMVYAKNNPYFAKNQIRSQDTAGMTVSVYTADGLLYQKTPGREKRTGLWNCAYINNGKVEERDEQIHTLADYAWVARDKENPSSWMTQDGARVEETYEYNWSSGRLIHIMEDRFDRDGNQTAYYWHNSDGGLSNGFEREYDEKGQHVLSRNYGDEGNGFGLVSKDVYEYDGDGRMIRLYFYVIEDGTEHLNYIEEWEYDENGKETVNRSYNGQGTMTARTEYEYDGNGNELSRRKYNINGVMWSEYKYEYDERGNETALYCYGENQLLEFRIEYKYDAEGNCISKYIYDENDICDWRREYENDENGYLRVEYSYNAEGMLTGKYEYNVFGDQTGIYDYKDGELVFQYNNVYDEDGVIMESYEYRNGKFYERKAWEYNESGECIAVHSYRGNSSYDNVTEYDHAHVYDAVGGMEIFYEYVNDILTEKKIILYY